MNCFGAYRVTVSCIIFDTHFLNSSLNAVQTIFIDSRQNSVVPRETPHRLEGRLAAYTHGSAVLHDTTLPSILYSPNKWNAWSISLEPCWTNMEKCGSFDMNHNGFGLCVIWRQDSYAVCHLPPLLPLSPNISQPSVLCQCLHAKMGLY